MAFAPSGLRNPMWADNSVRKFDGRAPIVVLPPLPERARSSRILIAAGVITGWTGSNGSPQRARIALRAHFRIKPG
jgi:hypothetical protein